MSLRSGTCLRCGVDFLRLQEGHNAVPVLYCGPSCRNAARNARFRARKQGLGEETDAAYEEAVKAAASARVEHAARVAEEAKAKRDAAERAEMERLARCPRRDKEAWHTREAVLDVIRMMRAADRPRASDLHPYACDCGAWHAGDRTAYAAWQARLTGETA